MPIDLLIQELEALQKRGCTRVFMGQDSTQLIVGADTDKSEAYLITKRVGK